MLLDGLDLPTQTAVLLVMTYEFPAHCEDDGVLVGSEAQVIDVAHRL